MEKDLNFEQAMSKLEKIATELEKGELSLDESVSKFEEGMKLSKQCSDLLENGDSFCFFHGLLLSWLGCLLLCDKNLYFGCCLLYF